MKPQQPAAGSVSENLTLIRDKIEGLIVNPQTN